MNLCFRRVYSVVLASLVALSLVKAAKADLYFVWGAGSGFYFPGDPSHGILDNGGVGGVQTFAQMIFTPYNYYGAVNLSNASGGYVQPWETVLETYTGISSPSPITDNNLEGWADFATSTPLQKPYQAGYTYGRVFQANAPVAGHQYYNSPLRATVDITIGEPPMPADFYNLNTDDINGDALNATIGPAVWKADGPSSAWSNPANWESGTPANGSNFLFKGSNSPSNNDAGVASVAKITFDAGSGPFSVTGGALTVTDTITNNSTNTQTIGLEVTLNGTGIVNTASGDIEISGTLTPTKGLIKDGSGELKLSNAAAFNTAATTTTVNAGTLTVTAGIEGTDSLFVSNGSTTANVFAQHVRENSLTIRDKGKVTITGGGGAAGTSVIGSLSIALPGNSVGSLRGGVEAVPEPGTLVLLAIAGLLGLLGWPQRQ